MKAACYLAVNLPPWAKSWRFPFGGEQAATGGTARSRRAPRLAPMALGNDQKPVFYPRPAPSPKTKLGAHSPPVHLLQFPCHDLDAVNINKRRGRKRRLSYLMPFQKALPRFKSPKLSGNALVINPQLRSRGLRASGAEPSAARSGQEEPRAG